MFFWKDVATGVGNCRMPSPILMAAIVWMFKLDITQNLFKVNIRKPKNFVGTLILIHLWSLRLTSNKSYEQSQLLRYLFLYKFNPLSANFTKWSNPLKQFFHKSPTNCLDVFDHFVGLALKGLIHHGFIWVNTMASLKTNCIFSANIYLFKINNRNLRKRCEICLKLTRKTP